MFFRISLRLFWEIVPRHSFFEISLVFIVHSPFSIFCMLFELISFLPFPIFKKIYISLIGDRN